ncbi:MAG: hypothetical protein OEV59_09260 [Deltaproteobacteria bacterium]|nr:hypothetical protein [Deltaproteobacteria bacterium]
MLISVFIFTVWSDCFAGDYVDEKNGHDWNGYPETLKIGYISGFMAGTGKVTSYVYEIAPWATENDLKLSENITVPKNKKTVALTREEINSIYSVAGDARTMVVKISVGAYSIRGITVGQIRDGLDILYQDFKNKNILIVDAIYVVKKQIEGTSQEDIEKILLYLRGGKTNIELLTTRDANGNIIKSIMFP